MQKKNNELLYSASDLVNFLECEHLTSLDLINLETPLPKAEDDEQAKLIQDKGYAHEAAFLEHLQQTCPRVADLGQLKGSLDEAAAATAQAMRDGVDVIFQATLRDGALIGHADFLRRVPMPSNLGDYSYEVVDTKLARSTRAKFLIQLLFYSEILAKIQGVEPKAMHVVLGDRREDLFGLYYFDDEAVFKPFWAHNRSEERLAFEGFMHFVTARLRAYPNAHIYHYAHYEATALKKLMSLHGTREAEVDNLLRTQKLVDLYKVVREGLRVSEPGYSIKNIEHFYMAAREGEVKTAGASVVYYEKWKQTGDAQLLKDIEDYNRDDVVSTHLLREWLLSLRPAGLPWANAASAGEDTPAPAVGELSDAEARLVPYRERLVDGLPAERDDWSERDRLQELVYQLLDFHRRAAKPEWWALFSRPEMTEDELIDDGECIGGMTLDPRRPPLGVNRSLVYTYRFPAQEFKFKVGDACLRCDNLGRAGTLIECDEDAGTLKLKIGAAHDALPGRLSICPTGPLSAGALLGALFRFADSMIADDGKYRAVRDFLTKQLPRIGGRSPGTALVDAGSPVLGQAIDVVVNLDQSYLFIQGPPGAGKTFTGSAVIVELLRRGFRVGVTSNSHKAINNLLTAIEKRALADGFQFSGLKKSTNGKLETEFTGAGNITNVFNNKDVAASECQLVAGTAWLFSDPGMDSRLDYLFVDEAGQVAVANLVAMGTSARNIVLLGDQMQLGQPIQGVHPGRSRESTLEFLLDGAATIAPERGIFLGESWRMHPDVCDFISDAVYDGRLKPEAKNANQRLVLKPSANPRLKQTGIRYVPIQHDGCSQKSIPEAEVVRELFLNLLDQGYVDRDGISHAMTMENILVVAPYNMQVNLLAATLPEGARVGTVDKFQGEEAEVVIVSMATSSGEYLPRHIEFLYSKNRLNVAISRATCLAILVASPALTTISCSNTEEIALVNTLCWVRDYSEGAKGD